MTQLTGRAPAASFSSGFGGSLIRYQEPDFLTFDEVVSLQSKPEPTGALKQKLNRFWRTPVVSNEAYFRGVRPAPGISTGLGPMLRVATWNIEKSLTIERVAEALTSPDAYAAMVDGGKAPVGSARRREAERQRTRLATADVIFLQEMDIGVSRSGYVDATRRLAQALDMNYVYAAQAIEVDPVLLGQEPRADGSYYKLDRQRYKGVFGSAILSRYPIVKTQVFQLDTKVYDWHTGEQVRADLVEKSRRIGSKLAFKNEISRELKIGGRCFFRADIAVPNAPGGVVTLINNHLEIKTQPKGREAQMQEILSHIKSIKNPIVMGGDHNSAPEDVSATSFVRVTWRQVNTPNALFNTTANLTGLVTGTVVPGFRERSVINLLKNFQNPLAPDIPVILPNPVRPMFKRVLDHRFTDGSSFDFRGDRERSINGNKGILANSNEKRFFGHHTTFSVNRPIGPIGRYRLDWFFVKSGRLKEPTDTEASYVMAPHYGETLKEFNSQLTERLSDHSPIVVDLPFSEPQP